MLFKIKHISNTKPLVFPAKVELIEMTNCMGEELEKEISEWATKEGRLIIEYKRYFLSDRDKALGVEGKRK